MNQGIGGNAVASGGLGPPASARYSRDVLGQSGVRWVIVFEGVNDIGSGRVGLQHHRRLRPDDQHGARAEPAHLRGYRHALRGNSYYTAAHETARQAVNTYIKSGKFDGFIDLDAAVRDASNPPKLQAAYDSGDGLHLNPVGYQKMADTVDLTLFTR